MIEGLSDDHSVLIKNFDILTSIPRCSGEEERISNYLKSWAEERDLEVYQDKALNIIIKKAGTEPLIDAEPIILQGHMDMVCEKVPGYSHDFSEDGIHAVIEGDRIIAKNTTLGADNGVAVAMIMTLLDEKDAVHPPIEALITSDEEAGMTGAKELDGSLFTGNRLINLDSEEMGVCTVGCAGGERNYITFPRSENKSSKDVFIEINLGGLTGGHSGMDIIFERGNANRLLARFLHHLSQLMDFDLGHFSGGSKSNAIPRDATAIVGISVENLDLLTSEVIRFGQVLRDEYHSTDSNLFLTMRKTDKISVVSHIEKSNFLHFLLLAPNGVHTMEKNIPNQVEASCNIGVVNEVEGKWEIISQLRSSKESKLVELSSLNHLITKVTSGEIIADDSYPAWEYNPTSPLREKASEVWKDFTGKELQVMTIHAGLECGILQDAIGELDAISIGPDMDGVHSPGENVSISSMEKMYEYLLLLLKNI